MSVLNHQILSSAFFSCFKSGLHIPLSHKSPILSPLFFSYARSLSFSCIRTITFSFSLGDGPKSTCNIELNSQQRRWNYKILLCPSFAFSVGGLRSKSRTLSNTLPGRPQASFNWGPNFCLVTRINL